jgi:DNA-binding response OmpR family regulator
MEKILVVEDEEAILMGLEDDLAMEGYAVETAKDGVGGLEIARKGSCDLILLDVMLPGMSGFDVCRQLRKEGMGVPILMLTAKNQESDKILGLELGADDYVTKPFSPRELLARVKALLRRTRPGGAGESLARFGDVVLDFRKYEATKGGKTLHLTSLEFSIMRLFLSNNGMVLSRESILDSVWGKAVYVNNKTVDTHIAHLRQKVEDESANPKFIIGVRGVGYKFTG